MAASKESATPGTKKPSFKDTNVRVSKRPAHGFHRFRSGMLNVTPKGGEKEQVRRNQNSPLLRLPPEIRTRVWEFVLGGNILRSCPVQCNNNRTIQRMRPPETDPLQGLPLLRTCRQIYAESALLPFRLNMFSFAYSGWVDSHFKSMRGYQRAQILNLQIDVWDCEGSCIPKAVLVDGALSTRLYRHYKFDCLPALKCMHVLIFKSFRPGSSAEECKEKVLRQLDTLVPGGQVDVTFEVRQDYRYEYIDKWELSP